MTTTGSPLAGADDDPLAFVDRVELALPARPELLFLARMTAAAVASRADFGYDRIEDLRLALDELCLTLLGGTLDDRRIRLQFMWNEDTIEVTAALEGDNTGALVGAQPVAPAAPNELSERILDALVDEHGFEHVGETPTSWMRMRRQPNA
jgi:hypothetical protein